jgi:hypothetical protein
VLAPFLIAFVAFLAPSVPYAPAVSAQTAQTTTDDPDVSMTLEKVTVTESVAGSTAGKRWTFQVDKPLPNDPSEGDSLSAAGIELPTIEESAAGVNTATQEGATVQAAAASSVSYPGNCPGTTGWSCIRRDVDVEVVGRSLGGLVLFRWHYVKHFDATRGCPYCWTYNIWAEVWASTSYGWKWNGARSRVWQCTQTRNYGSGCFQHRAKRQDEMQQCLGIGPASWCNYEYPWAEVYNDGLGNVAIGKGRK